MQIARIFPGRELFELEPLETFGTTEPSQFLEVVHWKLPRLVFGRKADGVKESHGRRNTKLLVRLVNRGLSFDKNGFLDNSPVGFLMIFDLINGLV